MDNVRRASTHHRYFGARHEPLHGLPALLTVIVIHAGRGGVGCGSGRGHERHGRRLRRGGAVRGRRGHRATRSARYKSCSLRGTTSRGLDVAGYDDEVGEGAWSRCNLKRVTANAGPQETYLTVTYVTRRVTIIQLAPILNEIGYSGFSHLAPKTLRAFLLLFARNSDEQLSTTAIRRCWHSHRD